MSVKIIAKERNCAIDIVKFIAVLMVLNSHMAICYPKYSFLATGGAMGDALFFFASGFALLFGGGSNIFDWYKRRIGRIYPSIFSSALIGVIFFGDELTFLDVIVAKKYWFVSCILVYYILIYPLRQVKDVKKYGVLAFTAGVIISLSLYVFVFNRSVSPYDSGLFRCVIFFLFMLQGAIMGYLSKSYKFYWYYVPLMLVSAGLWVGLFLKFNNSQWSILSIVPLIFFVRYLYLCSTAPLFKKIYNSKISGNVIFIFSQLCLESYLIQKYIFTDVLNFLFPLNILIVMISVILAAYIVRMASVITRQTIDSAPYNWRELLLYKK